MLRISLLNCLLMYTICFPKNIPDTCVPLSLQLHDLLPPSLKSLPSPPSPGLSPKLAICANSNIYFPRYPSIYLPPTLVNPPTPAPSPETNTCTPQPHPRLEPSSTCSHFNICSHSPLKCYSSCAKLYLSLIHI